MLLKITNAVFLFYHIVWKVISWTLAKLGKCVLGTC